MTCLKRWVLLWLVNYDLHVEIYQTSFEHITKAYRAIIEW